LSGLLGGDHLKLVPYGLSTGSQFTAKINSPGPYLNVDIQIINYKPGLFNIKTHLVGDYNIENVLAAICIGLYFDIPFQKIKTAIENYVPNNNRSQLSFTGKNHLLLDYYNANPSSTEVAVNNFLKLEGTRKVVILGDMLELGAESQAEHEKILKLLSGVDDVKVLLIGQNYQVLAPSYGFMAFLKSEDLKEWLKGHPIDQGFILIKGSRGTQLEKIIEML
jgi:UDP-N-acetylmuramoyl-tripeptide--D-alanyl-D-alanine ligase